MEAFTYHATIDNTPSGTLPGSFKATRDYYPMVICWQEKVKMFHQKMGQPLRDKPGLLDWGRFKERLGWLDEERDEMLVGQLLPFKEDVVIAEVADALADIIYVALGTANEMGLPMDKIFDAVHRANMAKVPVKDGKGKVSKPEGWVGPEEEIRKIIREAQRD